MSNITLENEIQKQNDLLEIVSEKEQTKFIETSLGKVINGAINIGMRAILPDLIEDEIIEIKDTLMQEGIKGGIQKSIDSAIQFGKSIAGIFTGKFDNISQVQTAVKKGGIIDGVSDALDWALNKAVNKGKIPYQISTTIKQGKNVILNNVSKNIENEFEKQLDSIEKLNKYANNWKEYYNQKDFSGMQKEFRKIQEKIKDIIPIENTIKEIRKIENIHTLIKNNNEDFNISKQQEELAQKLV